MLVPFVGRAIKHLITKKMETGTNLSVLHNYNLQETGWNGLIQDLITHKADMCATSLKLNSERARDIDFSIPFLDTGIAIIVKIRSGVLSPTAFLGNLWIKRRQF